MDRKSLDGKKPVVGIDPIRLVSLRVVEEVTVHVFEVGFLLLLIEALPDGNVEGAADLLHHGKGKLATFAGFLNLLVVELFGGGLYELMVREFPFLHEFIERLWAVFA
jgi:hypothetical protein